MRSYLLSLVGLALLGACSQSVEATWPEPAHRLLVVGWDGASFRMVDRLVAEGRLPNTARLLERGCSARLLSTIIPVSSSAWTGALTGKNPAKTGVYGFFEPVEGTYDVRMISALSNRASPLWRILTRRGLRSIVFGVPVTFPPEPLFGTMVAGMLSLAHADYAYPPELTEELRARGFLPVLGPARERRSVDGEGLARQLDLKRDILLELLETDWDLAFLVFKSLDHVSHNAYGEGFSEQVGPLYERLDAILGELVAAVGEDTNVLLISDHGFQVYGSGFNLHAWLLEQGFSVRKERVRRFRIPDDEPLERQGRQVILQLRNELDWQGTRAFATGCEGNFGSLRLNVAGREPEGSVAPEEVAGLLEEIAAALQGIELEDGRPLVRRVFRGAELYPGPHRAVVPDLLFEVDPEWQVFAEAEEAQFLGSFQIGVPDHDRDGIFVAAGPSISRSDERGLADVLDVCPTALHLLDQPVHEEMDGVVLTELLPGLGEPRVVPEADDPAARSAPPSDEPFTPQDLVEIRARLEALGYVQ